MTTTDLEVKNGGNQITESDCQIKAQRHHQISNPSTQLQEITVIPDDPVAKNLKELYNEFVKLVNNIKSALDKLIENETLRIIEISAYLGEYFRVRGLTDVTDIHKLFEGLWALYSYLDIEVLEVIVENEDFQIEEKLQKDMKTYKHHLEEFKESTTLSEFKKAVEEAFIPNPQVTSTTREVVIKINRHWGKKTLENFKTLVNHMFHQRMTHIRVEEGSICVTLIVPQSVVEYILKITLLKKEFASVIGMFELTVDGKLILEEKENEHFHFDQALQEASKLNNNDAVQYLLDLIDNIDYQNEKGRTALILASKCGHEQVVQTLLSAGASVDIQDSEGWTALMIACEHNYLGIVNTLFQAGANPNLKVSDDTNPLMIASYYGYYDIVEVLLQQQTGINYRRRNGVTALMLSSQNGHTQVIELLLKEHACVNIKDNEGWTALMLASQNGHTHVVELLIKEHADVDIKDNEGWTALMLASQNGHAHVVEQLIKEHADVDIQNKEGVTALMIASQNGHTEVVQQLLKEDVQVNILTKNGLTALMLASKNGHTQVVELILKENADVNIKDNEGWTALMLASYNGHTEVIQQLFKDDVDINIQTKNGLTALMLASKNGHTQVVELLTKELVDIDVQKKNGSTALMLACVYGHVEVAECLLQSFANPHIIAYDRSTAFSLAAYNGNRDLVNMLLDKAEPTTDEIEKAVLLSCYGGYPTLITFLSSKLPYLTDDQRELLDSCVKGDLGTVMMKTLDSPDTPLVLGLTPLMVASSCGHVDIVDALIQAGADVNKQESRFWFTPLFFAVRGSKSALIVETLLMYGASPNNIAVINETPLDTATGICKTFEMDAISRLLIKYGGQTTLQLLGRNKSEPKSSLAPDELQTTPTSSQALEDASYIIKKKRNPSEYPILHPLLLKSSAFII